MKSNKITALNAFLNFDFDVFCKIIDDADFFDNEFNYLEFVLEAEKKKINPIDVYEFTEKVLFSDSIIKFEESSILNFQSSEYIKTLFYFDVDTYHSHDGNDFSFKFFKNFDLKNIMILNDNNYDFLRKNPITNINNLDFLVTQPKSNERDLIINYFIKYKHPYFDLKNKRNIFSEFIFKNIISNPYSNYDENILVSLIDILKINKQKFKKIILDLDKNNKFNKGTIEWGFVEESLNDIEYYLK